MYVCVCLFVVESQLEARIKIALVQNTKHKNSSIKQNEAVLGLLLYSLIQSNQDILLIIMRCAYTQPSMHITTTTCSATLNILVENMFCLLPELIIVAINYMSLTTATVGLYNLQLKQRIFLISTFSVGSIDSHFGCNQSRICS